MSVRGARQALARRRSARVESGQVIVMLALMLPVFFGLGAIVIDVGNWYVHKRHLQTQVDAAVLAPAPQFVGCYLAAIDANQAIKDRALEYAGDTTRDPDATNLQVQEPGDVRVVLNSAEYWSPTNSTVDPTTGYGLDWSMDGDPSTDGDQSSLPCDAKFLDAKATDQDAPLLWGLLPLSASPKSKARVEIRQVRAQSGMLPWAVPEIDPRAVIAFFVNEDNGAIMDWQALAEADDPDLPWSEWKTIAGQEEVAFGSGNENTGVVIMVSKDDPTPQTGPDLAAACGQAPGLVRCYSGTTQTSGLSFIHAYNGGRNGGIDSPQARDVRLTSNCTRPPDESAPYFTLTGDCSALVQAVVDFGVNDDPRPLSAACASIAGFTWGPGGPEPDLGVWTGSVNLPAGGGRQTVSLSWAAGNREQGSSGNCHPTQPNSGTLSKVAAPYVANAASGPVQYLQLTASHQDGVPVGDANSVEMNDPVNQYYNYVVTVGLPRPLSVESDYLADPVVLRMASISGSQNQAYDCDRGVNFNVEIENGCQTTYQVNYDDHDEDGDKEWRDIACTGYSTTNLPPNTFDPDPVPDCVITETGDMVGQLRQGLVARFESPCVPNNWPDDPVDVPTFFGPNGYDFSNDPRYVTLIVTDDTAFTGSGNEPLPIKYFAGFYVTGWDYHPTQSPGCAGNDDHPIYGAPDTYNHNIDNGDVWGYFVNIVVFSGSGEPSEDLCAFGGDPGICVAVLVE